MSPERSHPLEELSAYLDGELEPAVRAQVEAHLAGCARCAAALDDLRLLAEAGGGEAPPVPAGLAERIAARLDAAGDRPAAGHRSAGAPAPRPPARRPLAWGGSLLTLAASLLTAGILWVVWQEPGTQPAPEPARREAPREEAPREEAPRQEAAREDARERDRVRGLDDRDAGARPVKEPQDVKEKVQALGSKPAAVPPSAPLTAQEAFRAPATAEPPPAAASSADVAPPAASGTAPVARPLAPPPPPAEKKQAGAGRLEVADAPAVAGNRVAAADEETRARSLALARGEPGELSEDQDRGAVLLDLREPDREIRLYTDGSLEVRAGSYSCQVRRPEAHGSPSSDQARPSAPFAEEGKPAGEGAPAAETEADRQRRLLDLVRRRYLEVLEEACGPPPAGLLLPAENGEIRDPSTPSDPGR